MESVNPANGETLARIALGGPVEIALACGNAVIVKPSGLAPTSALLLAEAGTAAGLPPGLINVVPGNGTTGHTRVTHPRVAGINFTGSLVSGRAAAAPSFKESRA